MPLRREELSPQLPLDLHRKQRQMRWQQQQSSSETELLADKFEEEESIAEEPIRQNDQVRPSPPPENQRNNLPETLHVDGSEFLSVCQQGTFHNDRFNEMGRVYLVGVDYRPQVQDKHLAFMHVMCDLENTMSQQVQLDDYVQLILKSNDLYNEFSLLEVRMSLVKNS